MENFDNRDFEFEFDFLVCLHMLEGKTFEKASAIAKDEMKEYFEDKSQINTSRNFLSNE